MYDVFFSYPYKDSKEVMQIYEALRSRGLNVWIAQSEIRDYASITRSIVKGLARSKVLLAYNSLNYAHSRTYQRELTAGFLAAQREGDPQQRVWAGILNPLEHIREMIIQKGADQHE